MRFYCFLILWTYLTGVVFYNWIGIATGFSFTDEAISMLLLLLSFVFHRRNGMAQRYFTKLCYVLGIFSFYIFYSSIISSNTTEARWGDLIIQIKPFLTFFGTVIIGLSLDDSGKRLLRKVILLLTPFMVLIGIGYFMHEVFGYARFDFLKQVFGHPACYATNCQIAGLLYLYCSERTGKDVLRMFFYFVIGLLSFRSRCYAFIILALILFFVWNGKKRFHVKNILTFAVVIGLVFYVCRSDIYLYFTKNKDTNGLPARLALYIGAYKILRDHILFGSGLASFATYYSVHPYASTYYDYDLWWVYGLKESNPSFVSDTFYPVLAQFGIVGIVLFLLFLQFLWKEIFVLYDRKIPRDSVALRACVCIFIIFLIESVVSPIFSLNSGMFMFMLLAMFLNEAYSGRQNKMRQMANYQVEH